MKNPFIYSDTNKRYHTNDYYLKDKYGVKVFKVSLNGGFTCPNRDGKVGYGGCIYCSKAGSGEYAGKTSESLVGQFNKGKEVQLKKWKKGLAIAYFQAFTNTYAPLPYLKKCFEPFISMKGVAGIAIATRPDCLSDEILDYLDSINKRTDLYVELGLQTTFDDTARLINRGYSYAIFLEAVKKLHQRRIKIVVHLINGLPGEDKDMMIENVKKVTSLPIFGLKFHCLSVLKDTALEKMYEQGQVELLSKDAYLDILTDQLTYVPPRIVIQRISTDAKLDDLIAPVWEIKKMPFSNELDKLMVSKDIYQGINYHKTTNSLVLTRKFTLLPTTRKVAVIAFSKDKSDGSFLINEYDKVFYFDNLSPVMRLEYKDLSIIHDTSLNISNYIEESIDCLLYNLKSLDMKTEDITLSLERNLNLLSSNGNCVLLIDDYENYLKIIDLIKSMNSFSYSSTQIDNDYIVEIIKK